MRYFIFIILISILAFSQCPKESTGFIVVEDLSVCFTKVEAQVSYHPECSCYYYNYNIISPKNNKGKIMRIEFNFGTSKSYFQYDNTLPADIKCDYFLEHPPDINEEKDNYIPISIVSCPEGFLSLTHTEIGALTLINKRINYIEPGENESFTIASKFPPGKRTFKIEPDDKELKWRIIKQEEEAMGDFFNPYDPDGPQYALTFNFFYYDVETVGPIDPDDLELFNGGGQKPDDVNLFLRYGSPKESQTELPSGTDKFEIFIYYGKTIKPETFKATLNDQDIKNLFHPVPGGGDYVKINLQNGRNVLIFSVDGLNEKGQTANDKDRLVLIVK